MTMQEAFQKALDGGFPNYSPIEEFIEGKIIFQNKLSGYFLDPEFWKALGKAKNWSDNHWIIEWHALITELIDGGTIEEYFANL